MNLQLLLPVRVPRAAPPLVKARARHDRVRARVIAELRKLPWYAEEFASVLRQDIIWHKPNAMPESVKDRCTKAHEYIFLLSRAPRYYYDRESIMEPVSGTAHARGHGVNPKASPVAGWATGPGGHDTLKHTKARAVGKNSRMNVNHAPRNNPPQSRQNGSFSAAVVGLVDVRNKRSVWTVATHACRDAHFVTFPPALIEPCILAGCPLGGVVLDPFGGSGTTGLVARATGRCAVLIELNPEYIEIMHRRLELNQPFLDMGGSTK